MDLRARSLLLAMCFGVSVGVLQVPLHGSVVSPPLGRLATSEGTVLLYHTVDVTVGTPPQKFNLSLDLGYYYAFVFDKKLQEPDCKQPSVPRRLFDRFRSTTYEQRTADDNPFAFGSDQYFDYCIGSFRLVPIGVVANDVITVSGSSTKANFAVIERVRNASLRSFWPSDGVLGMNRRIDIVDIGASPITNLAIANGGPVVTLFTGSDSTGRPGVLTLGGTDTANCDGAWSAHKRANLENAAVGGNETGSVDAWTVTVSSVKLGKFSSSTPMLAVLESWTMARVLPALFKQLVSTIGAEYDFASDEYVVACSAVKGLPDLVLTLKGGFEYRIPAREYVKNLVPRKDKKCTLLISEFPYPLPGNENVIALGWQMLSSYCWRFNYGANELAVAKAKPL